MDTKMEQESRAASPVLIHINRVLPFQVRYLVHRRVYAADVALVVPAAMAAALQLAVVITVTAAAVQEELIDAPVLYLLTERKHEPN